MVIVIILHSRELVNEIQLVFQVFGDQDFGLINVHKLGACSTHYLFLLATGTILVHLHVFFVVISIQFSPAEQLFYFLFT